MARLVERGLRESRAIDLEALVVLAGGCCPAGLWCQQLRCLSAGMHARLLQLWAHPAHRRQLQAPLT